MDRRMFLKVGTAYLTGCATSQTPESEPVNVSLVDKLKLDISILKTKARNVANSALGNSIIHPNENQDSYHTALELIGEVIYNVKIFVEDGKPKSMEINYTRLAENEENIENFSLKDFNLDGFCDEGILTIPKNEREDQLVIFKYGHVLGLEYTESFQIKYIQALDKLSEHYKK